MNGDGQNEKGDQRAAKSPSEAPPSFRRRSASSLEAREPNAFTCSSSQSRTRARASPLRSSSGPPTGTSAGSGDRDVREDRDDAVGRRARGAADEPVERLERTTGACAPGGRARRSGAREACRTWGRAARRTTGTACRRGAQGASPPHRRPAGGASGTRGSPPEASGAARARRRSARGASGSWGVAALSASDLGEDVRQELARRRAR